MQRKFSSALFLGALLLALSTSAFAARGYEAYYDELKASPWFDGVKSTIDYQDTTVDSMAIAVWCGIDNYQDAKNIKWIQGGWARWKNADPQIYWEYKGKDGLHNRGYDQAPGNSETYQQSHTGSNAEWTHGATVYKTVAWSNFDNIEFRKAQYGAEMLDSPGDHTPGKATANKNNFASTRVRVVGSGYANAGLQTEASTAQYGEVEKYGADGSGNFRTWDTRD